MTRSHYLLFLFFEVFAIVLLTSLDASTSFKLNERNLCIGRNCNRVHNVNEDCYYGNVTLPKRLNRLKTLVSIEIRDSIISNYYKTNQIVSIIANLIIDDIHYL